MANNRVLALDASTSTIGLAIIDYNSKSMKLIHYEYFKPSKNKGLFEKLLDVKNYILQKIDKFKPTHYAIEEIVLFMGGNSTAKTITSLAVLNRTVGLTIYEKTKQIPYFYNSMKIRHTIKKTSVLPKKEDMPQLVSDILKFKFSYKFIIKKGESVLADENFDMADAIACGLCHIYLDRLGLAETSQIKKKKKRKVKK